jgi:hypothetical protein
VIVPKETAEGLGEEEQHLKTILESAGFRKAPTLRSLLLYLWQHRGESVSEYSIAIDALGRKPDFDAAMDATVRVNVARLRQKLKEFYEGEGRTCPLCISIPLGRHDLEVRLNRDAASVVVTPAIPDVTAATRPQTRLLSVSLALVSILCVAQFVAYRYVVPPVPKTEAGSPRFWRSFIANSKPTQLFLSTPVFFEWNTKSVKVRDPLVNDFADLENSKELKALVDQLGPPRLMQNYTTIGDSLAALKLSRYLEKAGIPLNFGGTTELTAEAAVDNNVILMGTPWVTDKYSKQLQESFNFQYTADYTNDDFKFPILNKAPRDGEPARYETTNESDVRRISYGLITVLPGRGSNAHILSLRERPPLALISFLTVPSSLERLDQAWRNEGSPEYFEIVVGAEFDGFNVLRTWPAGIRAINVTSSGLSSPKQHINP